MTNLFQRPYILNHNVLLGKWPESSSELSQSIAGNSGNSFIGYSVARQLGQKMISGIGNIHGYRWDNVNNKELHRIRENHDCLVLLFQTHVSVGEYDYGLSLDYDGLIKFIDSTHLPLVIPSLGIGPMKSGLEDFVRLIPEERKDFFRRLSKRTINLGVRGEITGEVLRKIGIPNTIPIGCPSFFYNGASVPTGLYGPVQHKTKKLRLAFTSDTLIAKYIQGAAFAGGVEIVMQDEMDVVGPLLFGEQIKELRPVALAEKLVFGQIRFFASPKDWVDYYKGVDLAIGSRLHGAIAALQGGSRAVVFHDDMRTKEISDLLGLRRLPRVKAHTRLRTIYQNSASFQSFEDARSNYTSAFTRYRQFMIDSGVDFKVDDEFTHPLNVASQFDSQKFERTSFGGMPKGLDRTKRILGNLSRLRRKFLV